jgi:nickel transport protein
MLAEQQRVLALTEDQVVEKLKSVPVFTITNAEGAPLVATPQSSTDKTPVAPAFISQQDAQTFLDNLKVKNPDLAKNVKVVPISLAEVYKLTLKDKASPDHLNFSYIPIQQQVASATALLKQSDPKATQFSGVPLFVARGGKEKGYLTVQQGNQQVVPMFFEKEELQALLDRFKQQQPELAASVDIQAVPLEGVLQTLKTGNNPQLNQLMIIPPKESVNYLRSLSPQQPQQKPAPSAPTAPAPATPTAPAPAVAPAPRK